MGRQYLLKKLAEEAGEVVVAAIKHNLHDTAGTRFNLEKELGDLYAIAALLAAGGDLDYVMVGKRQEQRVIRERKRVERR